MTSFQHSAIVTGQGDAQVWGRSSIDQAQQILDHAAHPHAREHLREAGRELGLPPRYGYRTLCPSGAPTGLTPMGRGAP